MFRVHRNRLLLLPTVAKEDIPLVYTVYAVFTINTLKMEQKKERSRGGRPRKATTEKLKYRVAVKVATPDYFRLLTQAHKAGMSPSEYMRECFRNGHVKERLSEEHAGYVRQLCGMANNLNQLARKANTGGFGESYWDCKMAVARIHELINRIGI